MVARFSVTTWSKSSSITPITINNSWTHHPQHNKFKVTSSIWCRIVLQQKKKKTRQNPPFWAWEARESRCSCRARSCWSSWCNLDNQSRHALYCTDLGAFLEIEQGGYFAYSNTKPLAIKAKPSTQSFQCILKGAKWMYYIHQNLQ